MGIHELGLRKTILKVIEQQQAEDTELIQKNKVSSKDIFLCQHA